MKFDDAINGLVAIVFGGVLIIQARNFPEVRHIEYGPGLLPTLVGIGLIAAGTVLLVRRVFAGHGKQVGWVSIGRGEGVDRSRGLVAMALQIIAVTFYIAAVNTLGFLITMPIVLFSLIWWFDRRSVRAVLVAVFGSIVIHSFFYQVMSVPLPWGLLEPYARVLTW